MKNIASCWREKDRDSLEPLVPRLSWNKRLVGMVITDRPCRAVLGGRVGGGIGDGGSGR